MEGQTGSRPDAGCAGGAKSIRVLCVDDDSSTTELNRLIVDHEPDMECVGTRSSTAGVIEEIGRCRATVLTIDVRMPDSDPMACIAEARRRYPELVILVMSGLDDPEVVQETFARGADGYYLKTTNIMEMVEGIRKASRGEKLDGRGSSRSGGR